jgi:chromate reductase
MTTFKVGYIVGSLSKASINRKLATALTKLAPHTLQLVEIPIAPLPLYNYDGDADFAQEARAFKAAIESVDAVIFVTPEYNRSIPGALKNALDWGSRPWGDNSFSGKPAAIIGGSVGAIGTAAAQQHLKSVVGFLNMPLMGQPEAYVHITEGLIHDSGEVTNQGTAEFLAGWLQAFHDFVARIEPVE